MNTPTSAWLWNNVPLLDYTQFAWRTLGITSLTIALGAGIGAYEIAQTITQRTSTEITKIVLYSVFAVLLVDIQPILDLYAPYRPSCPFYAGFTRL
jgi:hypothetical protein